jgi:hypothetical protein
MCSGSRDILIFVSLCAKTALCVRYTSSCTYHISLDPTVCICVLNPLLATSYYHSDVDSLQPVGALFNNACSAQIFWSLSSIETFKILRKIVTFYTIFLTEHHFESALISLSVSFLAWDFHSRFIRIVQFSWES